MSKSNKGKMAVAERDLMRDFEGMAISRRDSNMDQLKFSNPHASLSGQRRTTVAEKVTVGPRTSSGDGHKVQVERTTTITEKLTGTWKPNAIGGGPNRVTAKNTTSTSVGVKNPSYSQSYTNTNQRSVTARNTTRGTEVTGRVSSRDNYQSSQRSSSRQVTDMYGNTYSLPSECVSNDHDHQVFRNYGYNNRGYRYGGYFYDDRSNEYS